MDPKDPKSFNHQQIDLLGIKYRLNSGLTSQLMNETISMRNQKEESKIQSCLSMGFLIYGMATDTRFHSS